MFNKLFHRHSTLVTTIIFLVFLFFGMTEFHCNHFREYEGGVIDQSPDTTFRLDESLPYYRYKDIEDSIAKVRKTQLIKLRTRGSGTNAFHMGLFKINECDTCLFGVYDNVPGKRTNKYFFELSGYKLDDFSDFSIDNGNYYLKYPVRDTETGSWVFTKKKIGIRYAHDPTDNSQKSSGSILIPVSARTHTFLKITFGIVVVLSMFFCIAVFLVMGPRTLYNIAIGKVFNKENIRSLYLIGWLLVSFAVLPPVLSILFRWIFAHLIPSPFYYPFWESMQDNKFVLISGVIVLLLAKAFKRGYRLQNEQDLTI
jgi:hypothetical protein